MAERPTEAPPNVGDRRPSRAAERIRQSARDLFYREGIRAVGVEAIVAGAGVTKPSLYRAFPSKDELAAAYLRDWDAVFWERFEAGAALYPDDPRARLRFYLEGLAARATVDGYRGCGLTNAAVEYPEPGHPARRVAEEAKRALRRRLTEMASAMGASRPDALGDGLLLLIEGAFATGQIFGTGGPARALVAAADALIDTYLGEA
ncbi:MAG: TetR/AcrR family transcriptional regulator [Bauldia sp.]